MKGLDQIKGHSKGAPLFDKRAFRQSRRTDGV